MSLATVYSRALMGVDAPLVRVEAHLSNGLPGLSIVGMAEKAVRESKDRVRSAILNANLEFPARRITINLAPADLPKVGGRYDLAIALSILAASGQCPVETLAGSEFLGELALSGELRGVQGALPAVVAARSAGRVLVLPGSNSAEAAVVHDNTGRQASHLLEVVNWLGQGAALPGCTASEMDIPAPPVDRSTAPLIRGQLQARRALEIAAAGRHNLLFVGPPGTGKTLLASALPQLLPPLEERDALELAAVRSVARVPVCPQQWLVPPFRAPHHSASAIALVGGGATVKPGEISLAHRGVLFLDELPEFNRQVLEVLREPLESGFMTLSRANYRFRFPAAFQLVAAMNPCPCGLHGDPRGGCRCSPERVQAYGNRVSGPLLDRIDLLVRVPRLTREELTGAVSSDDGWEETRQRVRACRERQRGRNGKFNNELDGREAESACALSTASKALLGTAIERLGLSARAYHRVLKLARTIADLDEDPMVSDRHLMEAISYRRPDP